MFMPIPPKGPEEKKTTMKIQHFLIIFWSALLSGFKGFWFSFCQPTFICFSQVYCLPTNLCQCFCCQEVHFFFSASLDSSTLWTRRRCKPQTKYEKLKAPHLQDVDPCAAARPEQSLPLADRPGCKLLPDSLWRTKFGQSVCFFLFRMI